MDKAYGEKMTIHRCLALEAVFMQMFVCDVRILKMYIQHTSRCHKSDDPVVLR